MLKLMETINITTSRLLQYDDSEKYVNFHIYL